MNDVKTPPLDTLMRQMYAGEKTNADAHYDALPKDAPTRRNALRRLLPEASLMHLTHWLARAQDDATRAESMYRNAPPMAYPERHRLHVAMCYTKESVADIEQMIARRLVAMLHDPKEVR